MAEQDQQESAQAYNERVLEENRAAERTGGAMKMLKVEGKGAVSQADKLANQALQKGLDEAKLALLPIFYLVLPLVVIFFIIVAELALPLVRPSWKLPLWRTVTYWVYVFLFLFLVFLIIGTFAYIYQHPSDFCKLALGGNPIGNTGCTVFGGLFTLLFGG